MYILNETPDRITITCETTRVSINPELLSFSDVQVAERQPTTSASPYSTLAMSQVPLAILDKERLARRTKLAAALQDEEDPLAFYEDFIKWTIDSFPHSLIPQSGLLELLEEAGRQFKSDSTYKGDRRYLKIWLTYARYVEDDHDGASIQIYKFLLQSDIGTGYAQLYEDYAATLERLDRCVHRLLHVGFTSRSAGDRMPRKCFRMVSRDAHAPSNA